LSTRFCQHAGVGKAPQGGLGTAQLEHCLGRRVLVWRFEPAVLAVSSAVLGGGIGRRHWAVNAEVPLSYSRSDPDDDLRALAEALGLRGNGIGMLTAADVGAWRRHEDEGAVAEATVGLTVPTWAAEPAPAPMPGPAPPPGTVNIVAMVPERLSEAALVNAVMTVTEAKSQALWEAGVDGTGTASDAVCVLCPTDGPVEGPAHTYGGPRSLWGARLARAVHGAVSSAAPRDVGS